MSQITFKGDAVSTSGVLPAVGATAPSFTLTAGDLSDATLDTYAGKKKVLNVFPSIETPVCQLSVKAFNQAAAGRDDTVVLNISADLPFAQARFCGAEGIEDSVSLSTFRSSFATDYGLEIADSVLKGLCSRAVIVVNADNVLIHAEQVPEIAQEPNYGAAIAALD